MGLPRPAPAGLEGRPDSHTGSYDTLTARLDALAPAATPGPLSTVTPNTAAAAGAAAGGGWRRHALGLREGELKRHGAVSKGCRLLGVSAQPAPRQP